MVLTLGEKKKRPDIGSISKYMMYTSISIIEILLEVLLLN